MNLTAIPAKRAPDAIASCAAANRVQPYRTIHKALRLMFGHALERTGALDAGDAEERAAFVDEVERLLGFCADHLAHENHFFHEPLRARSPLAVVAFDDDHADHVAGIEELRGLLARLRDGGPRAASLAYEIHLRLSQFVGESLVHMAEEESTLTSTLWAHFSDAEIMTFESALHATFTPEQHAFHLRWLARALNASELAELLAAMKQALPAPVFDAMADVARAELGPQRWGRIARQPALA
ncbi:MAG: hemerythrin domain-containing protein [Burkholderiales bacterium]|nr:hemerythrin domain-containing protein [Burkholderiales bacterium]